MTDSTIFNASITGEMKVPYYGGMPPALDSSLPPLSEDMLNQIRKRLFMKHNTETTVLIVFYVITFLVGLVGNILVIFTYVSVRKMRTITNAFLVNLAVCDLMVVCGCMPLSVAYEVYANWIYGAVLCKLVSFLQGISVSASILTLAVISGERFYAIRRPLRARALLSHGRIRIILAVIWALAAFAALPTLIVREEVQAVTPFGIIIRTCTEFWGYRFLKHIYNFTLLLVLYITPLLFIGLGYMRIGLNLLQRDESLYATTLSVEPQNMRANLNSRRRVAKMLFVISVLFAVSWLPYHVMSIYLDLMTDEQSQEHGKLLLVIHSYSLWAAHANSAINPICYCIMSSSFQNALRHLLSRCFSSSLCCCCAKQQQINLSPATMDLSVSLPHSWRKRGSALNYRSQTSRSGYSTSSSTSQAVVVCTKTASYRSHNRHVEQVKMTQTRSQANGRHGFQRQDTQTSYDNTDI